jgi:hypothetical protein
MSLLTSIPIVGGSFDDTPDKAAAAIKANQDLYNNIQAPNLKWQHYDPASFTPESAKYEQINQDPAQRSAQMAALNQLAGLSQTGMSDVDAAGYARSRAEAGQISSQGEQAALANAQNRGVGGSGLEFAMREMANQSGANSAQNAGLQQASDAAKQRAMYATAYGQGLSNMRGQDFQSAQANTNIVNQFNQQNTQARNAAQAGNIANQNQAQQYNNQGNISTQQANFNNQMTKAGGQAGANTGMANLYGAQNAANTSERGVMTGLAGDALMGAFGAPTTPKKPGGSAGGSMEDYSGTV